MILARAIMLMYHEPRIQTNPIVCTQILKIKPQYMVLIAEE